MKAQHCCHLKPQCHLTFRSNTHLESDNYSPLSHMLTFSYLMIQYIATPYINNETKDSMHPKFPFQSLRFMKNRKVAKILRENKGATIQQKITISLRTG